MQLLSHRVRAVSKADPNRTMYEGVAVAFVDRPTYCIVTDTGELVPWVSDLVVSVSDGPLPEPECQAAVNRRFAAQDVLAGRPDLRRCSIEELLSEVLRRLKEL